MRVRWTTRCCSIAVLIIASSLTPTAQSGRQADTTPLSLFPVGKVWTLGLGRQLTLPPAYAGSHAYFAIDGGQLVAVDLTTGQQEWTIAARPQLALTTGDDFVFVVENARVNALRTSDGSAVWQFALSSDLAAPPSWDNGWLILAARDGEIVALRAKDGYPVWRRDLKTPARVSPSLAADRVYIAEENGRILALQVDTGMTVWESRVDGVPTSLLAQDDRLFVGSTDNFFYCLLTSSGKWDWRWRTGADVIGTPAVDERHVYFVSLDNVLRALSRKTGGQQWARLLPLRPNQGPIKVGESLMVSGVAPTLRAYNVADGKPAGELPTSGELPAPAYALTGSVLPRLLVITRDLANGATATLFIRQIEPKRAPLAPLANPVPLPPLPPSE